MRLAQVARLVKYNDLQAAFPHWDEFAFGFNAAAKRPLGENKRESSGARFEAGNKSKAPGAVIRPGALREFQFPEYAI
jgi:hypothetical protein